jgi:hypothetical protein
MVHDGADVPVGPLSLDSVRVQFDEPRLISDTGLLVSATLAQRLGIEQVVNKSVWPVTGRGCSALRAEQDPPGPALLLARGSHTPPQETCSARQASLGPSRGRAVGRGCRARGEDEGQGKRWQDTCTVGIAVLPQTRAVRVR